MPMYEYKCNACENEFEELVFGEVEAVPCPKCASPNTRRLLSASCVRAGSDGPGLGGSLGPMPAGGCGGSGGFT